MLSASTMRLDWHFHILLEYIPLPLSRKLFCNIYVYDLDPVIPPLNLYPKIFHITYNNKHSETNQIPVSEFVHKFYATIKNCSFKGHLMNWEYSFNVVNENKNYKTIFVIMVLSNRRKIEINRLNVDSAPH